MDKYILVPYIKKALDNNIFEIKQGSLEYGTMGIICHFNNPRTPMEFYFNKNVLLSGLSPKAYVEKQGIDNIIEDISATIVLEMIPSEEFHAEALMYLGSFIDLSETEEEKNVILDIIDEMYKTDEN